MKRLAPLAALAATLALAATALAGGGSPAIVQSAGAGSCTQQDGQGECANGKALVGATDVAASADGKSVYVASGGSLDDLQGGVAEFSRDDGDGSIEQVGCATTNGTDGKTGTHGACDDGDALAGARSVAVSPDDANVYVVSTVSDAVAVFARDADTGELTQTGCVQRYPTPGSHCDGGMPLAQPTSIAISPDGKFVYVGTSALHHSGIVTYSRDAATGALTYAGCVSDDGEDGACKTAEPLIGINALMASPDGKSLYAGGANSLVSFDRDADTGELERTGCFQSDPVKASKCDNSLPLADVGDGAISPDGKTVYIANFGSDTLTIYDRDADTGKLTTGGCVEAGELGGDDEELDGDDEGGDQTDDEGDAKAGAAQHNDCAQVGGLFGLQTVAVSPDGKSLYTGSYYDDIVVHFRLTDGGGLESLGCVGDDPSADTGCSEAAALLAPAGMAVSPDSNNLYVTATGSDAVTVFGSSIGVSGAKTRVNGRSFKVALTCPAGPARCFGELRVLEPGSAYGATSARASMAGKRPYKVAAGRSKSVTVRISKSLKRALAKRGHVRVLVQAREHSRKAKATARFVTLRR